MQSSNPVLSRKDAFTRTGYATFDPRTQSPSTSELEQMYAAPPATRMTVDDVVVKTGILLGTLLVTGTAAWVLKLGFGIALVAALVGLGLALVIIFKRLASPGLIGAYAAVEGVFLGAVSRVFNEAYSGIVVQAVLGTAMCFGGVLLAYRSGRLRATPRFTKAITAALIGALGLIVVNLVAGIFVDGGLGIRDGGPLAIIVSLVFIGIASLSFVLDFDAIEKGVAAGAPSKESWLAAFGLVVGLVWLYTEVLRLLSYFRD